MILQICSRPPLALLAAALPALLWAGLVAGPARAAGDDEVDLFDLSLEELAQVQVTTVTGAPQDWFGTPAAIYVITGEQIRRSGHTSLAEAMRMVPGAYVGRVDSNQWAVSVRGFATQFANKLQVLVDGRVIYNELFGGVYWDVQTPLLEDVDRIEVIRGPGATLWGANAVNGVINVITKSAKRTEGAYASAGGGTEERGFGEARAGVALSEKISARVWGRYWNRDDTNRPDKSDRTDEWSIFRGGGRFDAELGPGTQLMGQAEGYVTPRLGQALQTGTGVASGTEETKGGHVLLRAEHGTHGQHAEGHTWMLKAFYDYENRKNVAGFKSRRDTADVEFQHGFAFDLGLRNTVLWGGVYRYRRTRTDPQVSTEIDPRNRDTDLVSGFVQNTISLVDDELFLMVGSKFEHSTLSGFEWQPSARVWWTPNERHTLWGAVSRPVRTPTLVEDGLQADLLIQGTPGSLAGNSTLSAEKLVAYELGYRLRPWEATTLDVAAFYFDYDDLVVPRVVSPTPPPQLRYSNRASADSVGVEVLARWQPWDWLRLESSYSYIHIDSRRDSPFVLDERDPRHQYQLRAFVDVTKDLELNTSLYYVDRIKRDRNVNQIDLNGEQPFEPVHSYVRLDLGLTWRPTQYLELALWGQDLLEKENTESNLTARQESSARIQRGFYGRVTLRWP